MPFGQKLTDIRKKLGLTQEELAAELFVTRQTVSNWETGKNYPDLNTILKLSEIFGISLDEMLKCDESMIASMDRERAYGKLYRKECKITDACMGMGTGLLIGSIDSPASFIRTATIVIGLLLIFTGWWRKQKFDKKVLSYLGTNDDKI